MIPPWMSDAGLIVFLAVCLELIWLGYKADQRAARADARRRHPSGRGRA